MDIEGTRNEKVLLIICAYVIGFTTAYIAFGVQAKLTSKPLSNTQPVEQFDKRYADLQSAPTLEINESGLVLSDSNGEQKLVAQSISEVTQSAAVAGGQRRFPIFRLSPKNDYVYYCIQEAETPVCNPYVYEVASGNNNPLVISGDTVSLANRDAELNWTHANMLSGDGIMSTASETPWVITLN